MEAHNIAVVIVGFTMKTSRFFFFLRALILLLPKGNGKIEFFWNVSQRKEKNKSMRKVEKHGRKEAVEKTHKHICRCSST